VTLKAHLRAADLPRLRASGPLGELLARQGEAHGEDHGMAELGRAHAGLPDDLLNFQYDPVACAVAAGWDGAVVEEQRLRPVMEGDVLRFQPDQDGRLVRVVVDLDGASFTNAWLAAVEAAQQRLIAARELLTTRGERGLTRHGKQGTAPDWDIVDA
jgi:hypothetical protein